MKSVDFVVKSAAGLVLGVAIGWSWAHHESRPTTPSRPDSAATTSQTKSGQSARERKVLYWRDPMVPGQRFAKPGKSPYMDMQLQPVYADQVDSDNGVKVSTGFVQKLGLRLGKVQTASIQQHIAAAGSVAFDEHLVELVQARVGGYVIRLHVKAPFDRVKRGDPLVAITSPDWQQAQQEYAALLEEPGAYAAAIKDAARRKLLLMGIPEAAVRNLERSRTVPPAITLHAPIDGVVTELGVRDGGTFAAGAQLFRINGLKTVWINAQIPESQRSLVSLSSSVTAAAAGWPGITFAGRLDTLLPRVDPISRTLTIRAVVANDNARLTPGMFVSLNLTGRSRESHLLVPSEAIIMTGQRSVVILARDDGSFRVANVTTGGEVDGTTIILSGLEDGQSIVLSGQFLIDSEASLTATINRLEKVPAPAPAEATP